SLAGERYREHDEIGKADRRPDRARPVDALRDRHRLPGPRDSDDPHAGPPRRPRDVLPDIAESDDAERGTPQPDRVDRHPLLFTLLLSEPFDSLGHPETPADRVFRHPRPEDASDARHDDAGR